MNEVVLGRRLLGALGFVLDDHLTKVFGEFRDKTLEDTIPNKGIKYDTTTSKRIQSIGIGQ